MNDRQLRHFCVLSETLSFRNAAEQLNIVQPALSMSIRRLEDEFGVALFDRTTRAVSLTTAGRAAYQDIKKALKHLDRAKYQAARADQGLSGHLEIGFVGSASFELLPSIIRTFRAAYPDIVLSLQESVSKRVMALLSSGDLDLGIIRVPTVHHAGVTIQALEEGCFVAVVPTGSEWAARSSGGEIDLRQLHDAPFINFALSEAPLLHMAVVEACREAGFVPRIVQEAIQVQTLVTIVESGLGVALVPSVSKRHTPSNAQFLSLKNPTPACETHLAVAYSEGHLSEAGRNFLNALLETARVNTPQQTQPAR